MTRCIGFDAGKFMSTAWEIGNDKPESSIHSVVKANNDNYENIRKIGFDNDDDQTLVTSKHISFNGKMWRGGAEVSRSVDAVALFDRNRFVSSEFQALTFLAIDGLGVTKEDFAIYFALPYDTVTTPTQHADMLARMKAVFVGKHHVIIDGVHKTIAISDIGVESQPVLAIFGYFFDDNFMWTSKEYQPNSDLIIYDHGFGDLGVVHVVGRKVDVDKSGESPVGMSLAARGLQDAIKKNYRGAKISLFDADTLIRQAVEARHNGKEPSVFAQIGTRKDVTKDVLTALDQYASLPVAFAYEKTGEGSTAGKIVVGGGAYAIHKSLSDAVGGVFIDDDPSTTVARGAAKVARKKFAARG